MAIDNINKADSLIDVVRQASSDQGSDKSTRDEQARLMLALMKPNVNIPLSIGTPGQMMIVNPSGTGMVYSDVLKTFLQLSDTPSLFSANKGLAVNAGANALEYVDLVKKFTDLTDTPATLTAGQFVKVNAGGTGLEFVVGPTDTNIGTSNLTINDNVRWLKLPNNISSTSFSIQTSNGGNAFQVNGNGTVILRAGITGSSGFLVYVNNVLVQAANHTGTAFNRAVKTNTISTEDSLLSGSGLTIGSSLGQSGMLFYQPNSGYLKMSPHGINSPVAPTDANAFGLFPNTTNSVKHPTFVLGDGNQIHLRRADLPTNPTNTQIATFLSNLGLANLI